MDNSKRFSWPVHPVAQAENCVSGKCYRFTVLTDRLIRMEYDPAGIFEDRASQAVFYRDLPAYALGNWWRLSPPWMTILPIWARWTRGYQMANGTISLMVCITAVWAAE